MEQVSTWTNVAAGVRQGSILRLLVFLIQINDLADELLSNVKLFADDTSLLFVVRHVDSSAAELYNDLAKISNRVHYWKMSFSAGSIKQDQDFIFNRNVNKDPHLPSTFDNNIVY